MTYYMSNMMNLNTNWTAEDGLAITKGNPETPKEFESGPATSKRNSSTQVVRIVETRVVVNGKVINNRNEPYPLLLFRGITYFPLTWRFAVEEFGWNYTYDKESGLNIRADNFFYESGAEGSGYNDQRGLLVCSTWTYYIKGDLTVSLETRGSRAAAGPIGSNLSIIKNGVEIIPEGKFGYYQNQRGPMFTIDGGFIRTTYYDPYYATGLQTVRVDMATGQVTY